MIETRYKRGKERQCTKNKKIKYGERTKGKRWRDRRGELERETRKMRTGGKEEIGTKNF